MADPNERVKLQTDEARGATTPGMTRYILGASMILIIVAFAVVYFVV